MRDARGRSTRGGRARQFHLNRGFAQSNHGQEGYRYGPGTAMRCLKGLMDAEMIKQEMRMEDTGDGNEKPVPTGRIRWKGKLK
jgi:hypothetical protein